MNQEELDEIHAILLKWFISKNKSTKEVIAFFTCAWIDQMNVCSEEFVDATLAVMKDSWKKHNIYNTGNTVKDNEEVIEL